MSLHRSLRSVTRTSLCVAAFLAASASPGSAADRPQTQAQLLDRAEFPCTNCFFGTSDHFYCFAAENQILVGYQRTPVLNWQDNTKNYLAPVHPTWAAWTAPGQNVPISYDEKYIWVHRAGGDEVLRGFWTHLKAAAFWVSRANSKQVRLKRSPLRDIFMNSDTCRTAAHGKGR